MTGDAWRDLSAELDQWLAKGRTAEFWWRDDDAAHPSSALRRLLRESAQRPLALAVIPARMDERLSAALDVQQPVTILQHGYAHVNHAPRGQGGWEQGLHRPLEEVAAELARGRRRLQAAFSGRFAPVLVPPWNRVDPGLLPALPNVGVTAVSTFGARAARQPAPGVVQVNVHCDVIRWKAGKRFAGVQSCIGKLSTHLHDRRTGAADAGEPTGLLTHHLDMDEEAWAFVADLIRVIDAHPGAEWIGIGTVLADPAAG